MTTISLLVFDQRIPDRSIKIMLLAEVEMAMKSGMKSRFGVLGF